MKIYSKLASFFAAMGVMMAFASCSSSDNNGYFITQGFPSCINTAVIQADGATPVMLTGMSYSLTYNYTTATVDVKVLNFKDANGTQYPEFYMKDLAWSMTQTGWKTISATDVQTTTASGAFGPLFSKFSMKVLDRVVGNYQIVPLMEASFTFNSQTYFSTLSSFVSQGTTTCYNADGTTYTPESDAAPIYSVVLDTEKGLATLNINNAVFDSSMNRTTMVIRDIPFRAVALGKYVMEADGPLAVYEGQSSSSLTENKNAKVSAIKCSFDGLDNFNLTFNLRTVGFSNQEIDTRVVVSSKQPAM